MDIDSYRIFYAEKLSDGCIKVNHEDFPVCYPFQQEWVTCCGNLGNEIEMAKDLTITYAESFFFAKYKFPKAIIKGDIQIVLPYCCALKIMLRNLMIEERHTLSNLAKLSGTSKQNLRSQLDLRKKTHIDALANLFEIIGHKLKICC